jgi:hypothetical protein
MSPLPSDRAQRWWAIVIAAATIAIGFVVLGPVVIDVLRDRVPEPAAPPSPPPATETGAPSLDDLEQIDSRAARLSPAEGGTVTAPGGAARLDVPPGALAAPTEIGIVRYRIHHPRDPAGVGVDLVPDGLALARPARLEMPVPPGYDLDQVELVTFDPASGRWVPEADQVAGADGRSLVARIDHFSLRRIRIRPGMDYPGDAAQGRATFYLESDAGNSFERYIEGRWRAVDRRTPAYRDLMRLGRLGRHDLILSGRLRAVTAARPRPEIFRDHRRTVAMPAGAPQARTGWVRIRRLDEDGAFSGEEVIARVNDYGPGAAPRAAGVILDLSRAAAEALGLRWGVDFGIGSENPDLAWMSLPRGEEEGPPLRYLPVHVEAYEPQPARAEACRLW